jgi:hypothetical protein
MNRSLRSGELNPQYGNELADRYLNRCGHRATDDDKLGFYAWSTSSSELRCLWSVAPGPYKRWLSSTRWPNSTTVTAPPGR